MPWQRLVADVACELVDGRPAYREVFVTTPRQSGKTTLFLSWQVDRCVNWGMPQRSVFTAQTGKDARDKWLDELFPLLKMSRLRPLIGRVNEGMGNESIRWTTGSIIRLLSTSAASGHSKTIHQAVLDEIWHDDDDRREQGLRPAMVTVPDAQLLICSTAGTQASTVYNQKRERGRAAAETDSGQGMAYFEWSAPDGWDPDDEAAWPTFMPALGNTIGVEAIRAERTAMEDDAFRRAYGNIPAGMAGGEIIGPDLWQRVCVDDAAPSGRLRFGLDVAEDRSSTAIVADDGKTVELVDHRPGTSWAANRSNELVGRHGGTVVIDGGGPAGSLGDDLDSCEQITGREVAQACGVMYDAVVDRTVTFRRHPAFDRAVEGLAKRQIGDLWVWSRRSSAADITPFMAATLAHARDEQPTQPLGAWR